MRARAYLTKFIAARLRVSWPVFAGSGLPGFRGLRPPRGAGRETRAEGTGGRRGAEGVDR